VFDLTDKVRDGAYKITLKKKGYYEDIDDFLIKEHFDKEGEKNSKKSKINNIDDLLNKYFVSK